MKRREFIGLVGGAAACWPLAAYAQAPRNPHRIAFVHSGIPANKLTETTGPFWVRRFHETLRALGDVEGSNLVIERYSAEGRSERFAPLAAEVVGSKPDVIIANLNDLITAFVAATTTIPIVAIMGDPIAGGFVANLARPGGNLTRRQHQRRNRNPGEATGDSQGGDTCGDKGRPSALRSLG